MNKHYDKYLVKKYPKLFRDRHAPMNRTAMCWGFEHGDGWFNILRALCGNIQHHIDWSRDQRARNLKFNRALKQALEKNDKSSLVRYFCFSDKPPNDWTYQQVNDAIAKAEYRNVPDACSQVVVQQVKEKFGGLRFYYYGGDEYIDGMVRVAETMSELTCEVCGAPGKIGGIGWVSCRCRDHRKN